MKAALYHGPGDVRIENVDEPNPGPGDIKVRPLHNGLCGTDLHQWFVSPMTPVPLPIVIGHEFSAEVVEVGRDVTNIAVGDLVSVDPLWSCGSCSPCAGGNSHLCVDVLCHGLGGAGGGLSEYTVVRGSMAYRVPEGVDAAQAALTEPMSVAYHGVVTGRPVPGATAVVFGAGPIGIGCYLALRALGMDDVVISEPAAAREAVRSVGAEHVIDPTATDAVGEILEYTKGAGAALTIDAAGVSQSFHAGLAVTGRRGRFVTLAAYMEPVSYNPTEIMIRELEIVSSFSSNGEFAAVLEHMAAGRYPTEGWVERVPFDSHTDAYDRLHHGQAIKVLVDVG